MAPAREASGVIAQLTGAHSRNRQPVSPRFSGHFDDDNSTLNTFQPENESTQQFDTAADAQSISTQEGIRRVHLSEGSDNSQSIEIGRGVKSGTRGTSGRHAYNMDHSEEQLLDLGDESLYNLTATPPTRSSQAYKSVDLRKQASVRRAAMDRDADNTKTEDILAAKTRNNKNIPRRTLSDMHAQINAISDSTYILPNTHAHNNTTRNSRFSKPRVNTAHNEFPTRFVAGSGLGRASDQTPRRTVSAPDASLLANQTAQSFMLPDLPNIAELVSGVRNDGTPVFSRTAKPKSRFMSASHTRAAISDVTTHAQVQSIALPEEEKAIFTSLQLLREKVAQLELEKIEASHKAEEFENEIIALKSQVQMERRLRRPDSGLGSDEEQHNSHQWRLERGRKLDGLALYSRLTKSTELQSSLKIAHERLEKSDRKHSVADSAVRRITQERDSLITQLGVAFYSNEELKEENMQLQRALEALEDNKSAAEAQLGHLQEANDELKAQLEHSEKQHDSDLRQWALREAELKARAKRVSHRNDDQRSAPAEKEESKRKSSRTERQDAQHRILERVEQEVRKARAEAVRQSKVFTKDTRDESTKAKSRSRSRARDVSAIHRSAMGERNSNAHRDQWLDQQKEERRSTQQASRTRSNDQFETAIASSEDDSKDITYLSFLDPAELSALRKKLEAERLASKHRSENKTAQTVPRKSSMKDATGGLDVASKTAATGRAADGTTRAVRVQSPETADAISYSTPEDIADMSVLSTASRRPQRSQSFEEMTSAFLLPDITIRNPASNAHNASNDKAGDVPKPIPVSERDVDTTFATVRPAQDPKDALAVVVAQLQDEIRHLKTILGKTEKAYERCDPAIGKRKRVELKTRIESLVKEIEKRSEQVYALYDVLEGQKDNESFGVEDTLQSLGIDLEDVKRRASTRTEADGNEESEAESIDIGDVSAMSY
ncbi:hypothetical protein ANO11243_064300 [Dothideomycetidae sp. 11243]|nr:hypothetical protein ANO11243_064300 [fungal sp. No.11243]